MMDDYMSHSRSEFPTQFDSFFFKRVWYIFQDYRKFLVQLTFATSITAIVFGYFSESIMSGFIEGPFEPAVAEPSQVVAFALSQFAGMLLILIPKAFFLVVFILVLPKMYENEQLAFSETGNPLKDKRPPENPNTKSIRTSKWKLIYNEYNNSKEFYDLEFDPNEENNLIGKNLEHETILWEKLQNYL